MYILYDLSDEGRLWQENHFIIIATKKEIRDAIKMFMDEIHILIVLNKQNSTM